MLFESNTKTGRISVMRGYRQVLVKVVLFQSRGPGHLQDDTIPNFFPDSNSPMLGLSNEVSFVSELYQEDFGFKIFAWLTYSQQIFQLQLWIFPCFVNDFLYYSNIEYQCSKMVKRQKKKLIPFFDESSNWKIPHWSSGGWRLWCQ